MQRPARPDRFDPQPLQRLIDLVGPAQAAGFLDQLTRDLTACAETIRTGAPLRDWQALRDGSHELISLAGSVGAVALHDLARALNAAAQDRNPAALDGLLPVLDPDLAALIALVVAMPRPALPGAA